MRASYDDLLTNAERGCLVLGDVSGYSDYLRDTELEHAQDVLADLIETVVRHLSPTLRLSKLEGDAAFGYALDSEIEASMLLDAIEETYFAFRTRLRNISHSTTCDCNACQLIPGLNLKFLVHHGRFVRRRVAGSEELTGADVVLVHRLLKNRIEERLGFQGYALLTDACVEALGIEPEAVGMRAHREDYSDLGAINGYVEDLEARWRYEDERHRVFITPAAAEQEIVVEVPAPPPIAWEFLTSPQKRALWTEGATRIDEWAEGGRRGVGTTTHCVHGSTAIVEEILDWRPFRYFSNRRELPGLGSTTFTWELHPVGEGRTEVRVRLGRLTGIKQRLLWTLSNRKMTAGANEAMAKLREVIEAEVEPAATASPS